MPYFTLFQESLFSSYDISNEEKKKLDEFLYILEESGIGKIIQIEVDKDKPKGGRPSYNPYRLFAAVAFAFSKHSGSIRKIEESIKFDLRFLYLMNQETPSYVSISKFLNNVVVKHHREIYSSIVATIVSKYDIDISDMFVDGTKLEANANKFKFVWKPTAHHKRLNLGIRNIIIKYFDLPPSKQTFTSKEVGNYLSILYEKISKTGESILGGKGHKLSELGKDYNSLNKCFLKSLDYEEKEETCGPGRNSYFKTDKDATAMCLKEDFYSGLGSNMHAAYNLQIIVAKGLIIDYFVSQDRNDYYTFIPFLETFYNDYGFYPKRICADSGYGSLENYKYLEEHQIENYVKHLNWKQYVNGEYVCLYTFKNESECYCLNGRKATVLDSYNGRHSKSKKTKFYYIDNCRRCKYKEYCMKTIKEKNKQTRVFEASYDMYRYREIANSNLLSIKGIEMRVNRSSQVEGAFGVIKQDMDYDRVRRRGLDNVTAEIMLVCLGYLTKKVFALIEGKANIDYWKAPESLQPEIIKETNIDKLMKKKYKGENEKLRKSYKRKKVAKK